MYRGFALAFLGLALIACSSEDVGGSGGVSNGGSAGSRAGAGNTGSDGSSRAGASSGGVATAGSSSEAANAGSANDTQSGGNSGASDHDHLGGEGGARAPSPNVFIDEVAHADGCLPRPLAVDAAGQVRCSIIEAKSSACDCATAGRGSVDERLQAAVHTQLLALGQCTAGSGSGSCADFCMCALDQEQGSAQTACQADPDQASQDAADPPGFCYIDDPASAALAACPASEKRRFGFISPSSAPVPAVDATLFVACTQ